jgi:hypothetical protein
MSGFSTRLQQPQQRWKPMFAKRHSVACSSLKLFISVMLFCAFLCSVPVTGWSDLLTLQSGETLSGRLLRIKNSTLVFRTSLEGQMMLPVDRAKKLTTDALFSIQLSDGETLIGRFGQSEEGQVLFPPDPTRTLRLTLEGITEALPIPTTIAPRQEKEESLPKIEPDTGLRLQTSGYDVGAVSQDQGESDSPTWPALTENMRKPLGSFLQEEDERMKEGDALPPPLLRARGLTAAPIDTLSLRPRLLSSEGTQTLSGLDGIFRNTEQFWLPSLTDQDFQLRLQHRPGENFQD